MTGLVAAPNRGLTGVGATVPGYLSRTTFLESIQPSTSTRTK